LYESFTVTIFHFIQCCALNFSPELFDYNQLIGKDTTSTLQHAFTVAHEQLGVLRLLDPEGWHFRTLVCVWVFVGLDKLFLERLRSYSTSEL